MTNGWHHPIVVTRIFLNGYLFLQLTVEIWQFIRLTVKGLAVLRLSVNPIEIVYNTRVKRAFNFHI